MRKWRLALDVDDVLIDTVPGIVALNNVYFGQTVTEEEYDEHWSDTRWAMGYPCEEWARKNGDEWARHALETEFYRNLPAMPGARKALIELTKLGMEPVILTSRRKDFTEDTFACFGREFPGIEFRPENYHTTGAYDGKTIDYSAYKVTKGEMIAKLDVATFVDDQAKHVRSAFEHGVRRPIWFGKQKVEVLRQNRVINAFRGIDWEETTRIIRQIVGV